MIIMTPSLSKSSILKTFPDRIKNKNPALSNSSGLKSLESSDGALVKALTSYQCGPGSIPARFVMRIKFVVGSYHAPGIFLQVLGISTLHENEHLQIPIGLG